MYHKTRPLHSSSTLFHVSPPTSNLAPPLTIAPAALLGPPAPSSSPFSGLPRGLTLSPPVPVPPLPTKVPLAVAPPLPHPAHQTSPAPAASTFGVFPREAVAEV